MNIGITIPVPAGNGTGVPVDISALAANKTIVVSGMFQATVTIESSGDGVIFGEVLSFTDADWDGLDNAARFVRARVSGYLSGTPIATIMSEDFGAQAVMLPVPPGNGVGVPVDVTTLPRFKTVTVGGTYDASVHVEISIDGFTFVGVRSFPEAEQWTEDYLVKFMRVRVSGYKSGTPIVVVAAAPDTDLSVAPDDLAVADANGVGVAISIFKAFVAGGGGVPDDVVLLASAPFSFRVLETILYVSTAVGGSTCTLRDALGGLGTALSDSFSSAAPGTQENVALTATGTVLLGGVLTLNRSDNGVAGEVVVFIQKI